MFKVAYTRGSFRVGVSLWVSSGYDYQWGQAFLVQGKRVVESGTKGGCWPPRILLSPQHHNGICSAGIVALADIRYSQCYVRRPQERWGHEDHCKQYHPYSVLLVPLVSVSSPRLELGNWVASVLLILICILSLL